VVHLLFASEAEQLVLPCPLAEILGQAQSFANTFVAESK
jgi:hypothetical protein